MSVDAGDVAGGLALLEGAAPVRRLPDTYRWIELWGYEALVEVSSRHSMRSAAEWRAYLESEASAMGMRPLAHSARRLSLTGPGVKQTGPVVGAVGVHSW